MCRCTRIDWPVAWLDTKGSKEHTRCKGGFAFTRRVRHSSRQQMQARAAIGEPPAWRIDLLSRQSVADPAIALHHGNKLRLAGRLNRAGFAGGSKA